MKYELSIGLVIKHTESFVEVIIAKGVEIDQLHADELNDFLKKIMTEDFVVLSNLLNDHSYRFNGSLKIGNSPLQKKTALLVYSADTVTHLNTLKDIQQLSHPNKEIRFFSDRTKATQWLNVKESDRGKVRKLI